MDLLLGSQQPIEDRTLFFKSQIFFWMQAAIDGHAKNFSVFLEPNSTYRMASLYDVMSAFPLMHPKGIPPKKAKMAMALSGPNRHFHWSTIMPRHFHSTARDVSFPVFQAEQLLAEMKQRTESVILKVETMLPVGFPEHISEAIFEGLRPQSARIP